MTKKLVILQQTPERVSRGARNEGGEKSVGTRIRRKILFKKTEREGEKETEGESLFAKGGGKPPG